ncbi:MAG: MoaD/ThiS family protein [Anaerolineae bacterium]
MQITVRLFGRLREHLPQAQRGRATLALRADATVQDVLDQLTIAEHVTVAINDEHASEGDTLGDGDTVQIFEVAAGG